MKRSLYFVAPSKVPDDRADIVSFKYVQSFLNGAVGGGGIDSRDMMSR